MCSSFGWKLIRSKKIFTTAEWKLYLLYSEVTLIYFNEFLIIFLLLALSATLAGHVLNKSFVKYDIYLLTLCSFLEGGLILISASTSNIYVAYLMYILFGIFFHFIITLVTAFVARCLTDDSFALIFGINTLVALVIQTIFTVIFVTETASLSFSPKQQFYVFGYYFIGLGVIYTIASIVKFIGSTRK